MLRKTMLKKVAACNVVYKVAVLSQAMNEMERKLNGNEQNIWKKNQQKYVFST